MASTKTTGNLSDFFPFVFGRENGSIGARTICPLYLDRANQALGRLDGLTTLLPDTRLFLYLYVRKEALLSSQIARTTTANPIL